MQLSWLKRILLVVLLCLCISPCARASKYYGQVTFGGLPVPGVTITATQNGKTISATSDEGGVFHFDDLADGPWKIEVKMQCFETIDSDVTVAPGLPAAKWELKLLPSDKLQALANAPPPAPVAPLLKTAAEKKPDTGTAQQPPPDMPKPPDDVNAQSADGFLVNGSVNNAATSQFSLNQAFGNHRYNTRSLYNGGFALILDNSALDARQYSLSGFATPKPAYDRVTAGFTIGGPIRIPHLLPRGPNFFAGYRWTRNHNALTDSALVPTLDERAGILPDGSTVAVSPQASALLALYPLPNLTGNPVYNFQIPVLDSSHEDTVQTHLDKTLGRRDQLWGNFNLDSTRADNVSLFRFVDTTDTFGLNTNIDWQHRLNTHVFINTAYHFSRLRTLIRPEFENTQNISGEAGIAGNDQDPANWGPPTLGFNSGIASLTDGNSAFNRNRTDGFSGSLSIYRGRHNITAGGDLRKQEYNDFFQQNPRGNFSFTGATTGSDFGDFLAGVPYATSLAFGNADKYFRQTVYDAYITDDWRVMPILTINAGVRWEYGAPMTELKNRLVNLDVTPEFTQAQPVLASDPVGPVSGQKFPSSLVRPDYFGIEPRIGLSWRPIPASTIVIRAGYGIYHDTSVYLTPMLQLAQQAPLSKSVKEQNSPQCPLTLADGFTNCGTTTADTFAIDPNFRVGYAQTWQVSVQRDLPWAMQMLATYLGVKGTHGVQEFLPNSYPYGGVTPCPDCPVGFVYQTSGGNSTRQSGQMQLRRRLRGGLAASLLYTYSKSIDDDAALGGTGHQSSASQTDFNTGSSSSSASSNPQIAQDWLDLKAERSLSSFDQRHLLNLQAQYTTGQGLEGGTLLGGWRGRVLKEWTVLTQINVGSGLPETPVFPLAVPGTGYIGPLRPNRTSSPLYGGANGAHINSAAFAAPAPGSWGTAGRNSITGPNTFSLDGSMQRTFRPNKHFFLDARIDATNVLNHPVFSGWNTVLENAQFGLPQSANPMRSLQVTMRVRF